MVAVVIEKDAGEGDGEDEGSFSLLCLLLPTSRRVSIERPFR